MAVEVVPRLSASRSDRASPAGPLQFPDTPGVARFALAVIVGFAAGAATEWSVPHLSFTLEPLSNAAAPWVLVAFAVALTARRTEEAVVLAVLTFLALVLGFYVAEAIRGWPVSRHQVVFWFVAGFIAGPLVGLAADRLRRGGRVAGGIGAGILGGILVGEAVHFLRQPWFLSPHRFWHVQLALGIGLTVGLTLWRSRRDLLGSGPALAGSLAACAAVGLATFAVYQVA
jgi:Family of unknown function (DUF6518)